MQTYHELIVKKPKKDYVPHIFGFKIYKQIGSKYYEPRRHSESDEEVENK